MKKQNNASSRKEVSKGELEWRFVRNATWAKTFLGASRHITTDRGNPELSKVAVRRSRDVKTGMIIDECRPDDVADINLHRPLERVSDSEVERNMKDMPTMFDKVGPDVCEVFSPPRVVHDTGCRDIWEWTYDLDGP